jgi:hypothetical protein
MRPESICKTFKPNPRVARWQDLPDDLFARVLTFVDWKPQWMCVEPVSHRSTMQMTLFMGLPPEETSIPLPPPLATIVWDYAKANWWQSGLHEELLDFIEDNKVPDLIWG